MIRDRNSSVFNHVTLLCETRVGADVLANRLSLERSDQATVCEKNVLSYYHPIPKGKK
jgi:hypothetical protein